MGVALYLGLVVVALLPRSWPPWCAKGVRLI